MASFCRSSLAGPDITTRPVSMRYARSARPSATAAFCSTSSTLTRSSRLMVRTMRRISRTTSGASPSDGSSSRSSRGRSMSARDGQNLLLAAGERAARLLLALGEHGEVAVHALEVLRDTAAPAPRVGAQAQVLLDGEVHERAAPLGRVADAEPHQVFRRAPVDALPREADLARRADHAAHRAQRRRLARAVGAQNRGDAALLDGEVDEGGI